MGCRISFIVPVYNVEDYLERCISSVQQQKDNNWELILVDDGSTDTSLSICLEYAKTDERIRIIQQQNSGSAVARNCGLEVATGDWIAFLDGDDWIEANYIEVLSPYIKEDYDFIMYSYWEVQQTKKKSQCKTQDVIRLSNQEFQTLIKDSIDTEKRLQQLASSRSQFWTKLYRREFLQQNHLQADPNLRMSQDVMFQLEVYRVANKAIFIPKELYNYRILNTSTCHRYSGEQVERILKVMYAIRNYVDQSRHKSDYQFLYQKRILTSLVKACILDFCHKDNPNRYSVRKKSFRQMCEQEPFASALTATVIRSFSCRKQICMWLVKWRWFGLLNVLLRSV